VHDATAVGEIIQTENLGFCAFGEGGYTPLADYEWPSTPRYLGGIAPNSLQRALSSSPSCG
jgi:hypothetical protein